MRSDRSSRISALGAGSQGGRSFFGTGAGHDGSFFPEVGHFTITGVPGYTGWIPGKQAENVVGATFQKSNELACMACEGRGNEPMQGGRRVNPFGLAERAGTYVLGYTGFIPGKYADNVFGHTAGRENELSQLIKGRQAADRERKCRAYREGRRPPTGHIDHAGYHSYGSGGGIDSRG